MPDVTGPIPPDAREDLPDEVLPHLPLSSSCTVAEFERAMGLYLAGRSCAACEARTGVNAETLRTVLHRAGLMRTPEEAQHVCMLDQRRRARRLFRKGYPNATVARLVGIDRATAVGYCYDWQRGVPIMEWSQR